ncbi:MAG: lysostaphin resistance A-like protein [Sarcina sp.]
MRKYTKGILLAIGCIIYFKVLEDVIGNLPMILRNLFMDKPIKYHILPIADLIATITTMGDIGVIVVTLILIKFILKKDIKTTLNFKKFEISKLQVIIPLGVGGCLFFSMLVNMIIGPIISHGTPDTNIVNHANLAILIVGGVIFGPIAEELIFRGVLLKKLKVLLGAKPAIFISAIAFGVFHWSFIQTSYTFFLGIGLALIYLYTDSLIGSIVLHMTANLISFLFTPVVLYIAKVYGMNIGGTIVLSVSFFIGAGLILIAFIKYKVQSGLTNNLKILIITAGSLIGLGAILVGNAIF